MILPLSHLMRQNSKRAKPMCQPWDYEAPQPGNTLTLTATKSRILSLARCICQTYSSILNLVLNFLRTRHQLPRTGRHTKILARRLQGERKNPRLPPLLKACIKLRKSQTLSLFHSMTVMIVESHATLLSYPPEMPACHLN